MAIVVYRESFSSMGGQTTLNGVKVHKYGQIILRKVDERTPPTQRQNIILRQHVGMYPLTKRI